MTANREDLAGLRLARSVAEESWPQDELLHILDDYIGEAQSAPEPVQGDAVAWQVTTGCALPAVYDKYPGWAVGDPTLAIVPLYTAAAKPDTELVELLSDVMQYAVKLEPIPHHLIDRIDAKLAELQQVKP